MSKVSDAIGAPRREDLSDLPEDHDWYWWPYGEMRALVRRLDEKRYVAVIPFLFTSGVVVGDVAEFWWYHDRWCYHQAAAAIAAATVWDGEGEPEGWHRHPPSGRRREHGDPALERVEL